MQFLQQWNKNPFIVLIIGIIMSTITLNGTYRIIMQTPVSTLQQVVLLMVAAGIFMTIISYTLYKSDALHYLHSLRWLLLLIVLFAVGAVLINLWLLSQTLFFSTYYLPIITTMIFFAAVTAISSGYFVSRAMTDRIFQLSHAADKLAQGDLTTRLVVKGNDEITFLMNKFNQMATELQQVDAQKQQLEQTRRDLIAWVSHDLRTPLTSMRVMLEALADGIIDDEETQIRYINTTLLEIQHLNHLINDLFELAQLDIGHLKLDYSDVPIPELISDTLGGMAAKAHTKNIALKTHIAEDIDLMQVAPDKIQRVLKNLLDNALKYTPANETVTVSVYHQAVNTIRFDVHNTGVFIAADTLPNVFKSFYRGDTSRANSADERGTGLGLAIARGFIQAHGGDIWAESNQKSGTTFSFTLPRHTPLVHPIHTGKA